MPGYENKNIQAEAYLQNNHDREYQYAMNQQKTHLNEPMICKHFGCGQTLSNMEQLRGDYCVIHSIPTPKPEPTDFAIFQ